MTDTLTQGHRYKSLAAYILKGGLNLVGDELREDREMWCSKTIFTADGGPVVKLTGRHLGV